MKNSKSIIEDLKSVSLDITKLSREELMEIKAGYYTSKEECEQNCRKDGSGWDIYTGGGSCKYGGTWQGQQIWDCYES
jgi:hypothetical protein